MTTKQALEWLIEELGTDEADATLSLCVVHSDALEQIVIARFEPSDPRRQTLRQAVRILIEEAKGLK